MFEIAAKIELVLLPGKATMLAPRSIRRIQVLHRASGTGAARASVLNEGHHGVGPLKQVVGRCRRGGWEFESGSPFEHAAIRTRSLRSVSPYCNSPERIRSRIPSPWPHGLTGCSEVPFARGERLTTSPVAPHAAKRTAKSPPDDVRRVVS